MVFLLPGKQCNEPQLTGRLRKDRVTKNLVRRLRPGDIALLDHTNLDWVAAESLVSCGVRAILNTGIFCTGLFPPTAIQYLVRKGIRLVDRLPDRLFDQIKEGERISLLNGNIYYQGRKLCSGEVVTAEAELSPEELRLREAVIEDFVVNTLDYAYRERLLITEALDMPRLKTNFFNRDVVVVVRGKGYREDLNAINRYMREKRPALVGVDGGGDALLEHGFIPDIIVGDMDSVSDKALIKTREVVVHAYPDGRGVPGRSRLEKLGLEYKVFTAPGTSEDIALLMPYELGAALIVAIGTHSSVVEFLEKGRKGMSSTFLVRLKVGDRLVDAKGVSRLYNSRYSRLFFPAVIAAGVLPVLTLILFSPLVQHLFRLIMLRVRFAP